MRCPPASVFDKSGRLLPDTSIDRYPGRLSRRCDFQPSLRKAASYADARSTRNN
jgi:hypothetical protein